MMKRNKFLIYAAAAAVSLNALSVYGGDNQAVVNGSVSAVVSEGRAFISLRGLSEVTGAEASLSGDDTAVISFGETEIIIKAGSNVMSVNGEDVETDTAAKVIDSQLMLPLRAISEALGAEVSWNGEAKTVTVTSAASAEATAAASAETTAEALSKTDTSKWQYNEESNVYWQVGINYCSNPADLTYETMGIFVPGEYMDAEPNGDGTYTCRVNTTGQVKGYTSETAPMVIPVNTPGYSAMAAPTGYVSGAESYTSQGFIYVNPGCRGRDAGAPTGVADLKAAIRYVRYSAENIPGNTDRIFTFGMSGGGAQSALVGATGNSSLYTPYLQAIGAVEGYSDAVAGSMCWCPITNLDYANEAYEWNMGITRTDLDEDMQALSDGLASAYADYINSLGLKDENGNVLTLEESENGIYQAGSYYEYIKSVIENSLNNFLSDTAFPYTPASSGSGRGGNFGGGNMNLPEGDLPNGNMAGGDFGGEAVTDNVRIEDLDGIARSETAEDETDTEDKTYDTPQKYIDSLNSDYEWVIYDSETNTAEITSVEDFVKNCKKASKSLGAFDQLDRGQGENTLFGYGDGSGAHFDSVMARLLAGTEYEADFNADLSKTDSAGNTVDTRIDMYTPLYYISSAYDGYGSSDVADFWRIRTGINQSDTALSTEVNLALALESFGKDVDFETVWGQAHVEAERSGSSSDNFITWVNDCLREKNNS